MPVVVRNFQILSSFISFGAVPALFFLALAGVHDGRACAQDSTTPAAEAPTQTAPDSAPAPTPDSAPAPAAAPAVADNAQQYVLNQQKLTRSIREIRNPLPGPDKAAADKVLKVLAAAENEPAAAAAEEVEEGWRGVG